jgi:hypothetical protein
MAHQRHILSRLGRLGWVAKKTREAARRRGLSTNRHSLIERLEPRVVLNGAPVAVADPWYSTAMNTALNVTTQGTPLVANDWDAEGSSLSPVQVHDAAQIL